jgi:hypothetical protein
MFLKFCLSYRVIAVSCLLLISYGCTGLTGTTIKNENISKLPSDVDFYISPQKEWYRPYEKVTIYLKVKENGTFQANHHIPSNQESQIHFTGLTKVNNSYTYTVDWKNIHRNFHGHAGKTKSVTWYLNNNWNNIIPQKPGKYLLQFNISTPVGYWTTDPITINIHIPLEDSIPLNEFKKNNLHLFFEHEYVSRMYNKNWSTYESCPKIRLPYEEMQNFVKRYPHFYLTKSLKYKLKRTKRIIVNKDTKYDVDDINQVNKLLIILEN